MKKIYARVKYLLVMGLFLIFGSNTVLSDAFINQDSRMLLKKLVETNSGSQNKKGLDKMRSILIPEFKKLGYTETIHSTKKGRKVLMFEYPGSNPHILYMGHVDTVFPQKTEFKQYQDKGDKIIGPGIIDMKAGIVLMLDILKSVDVKTRKKVKIILNDDEEVGSFESSQVYIPLVKDIRYALVFEPGLSDGSFISSESGVKWINLEVKGRASHAGLEPDLGVNACVELAKKIISISELTDYSRKLTINVGVISGGTKPNVVCENATARIDIRYVDRNDLATTMNNITKISNTSHVYSIRNNEPTTSELKPVIELPSLNYSSSKEIVKIAEKVATDYGMDFKHQHVGYGSDGNYLSVLPQSIKILVGLGPYGKGMHTNTEQLYKKSYRERLQFNIALLKDLINRKK